MIRYAGLGTILLAAFASAAPQESKKVDNEIAGTVQSVDTKKKEFAIALADKSERVFLVTKDTRFVGPRGRGT